MEPKGAASPSAPSAAERTAFAWACRWAVALTAACLAAELWMPTQYGKFATSSSLPVDSRVGW